jgi:hypothetical protein
MGSVVEGPELPLVLVDVSTMTPTARGFSFRRSYNCVACGLTWKEDEFQTYQGKKYGIPCGCYKDIEKLMNRGK